MQYYGWLVFLHLVGLVVFVAAHGASMWVAFAIRAASSREVVAAQLELSRRAIGPMYVGLLLLGIGGLGAAWVSNQLVARWVVASYVVIAIVLVTMWAVASPYYMNLRKVIADPALGDAALAERLRTPRPLVLLAVGLLGLVVLVWLMVLKPG
jgi:hypothetical protein